MSWPWPGASLAAPRMTPVPVRDSTQRDAWGREIFSPERGRQRFDDGQTPRTPEATREPARAVSPFAGLVSPAGLTPSGLDVTQEWYRAILGVGIGATGLNVADINADGT